jgi:hypothetical protein
MIPTSKSAAYAEYLWKQTRTKIDVRGVVHRIYLKHECEKPSVCEGVMLVSTNLVRTFYAVVE